MAKKKAKKKTTKPKPGKNKTDTRKKKSPGSVSVSKGEMIKVFCAEYLKHFNATKAYKTIKPKSTQKTAGVEGCKLLKIPNTITELAKQSKKSLDKAEVTITEIIREAGRIALSDVGLAVDENECLLPMKDIPPDIRRCISSFEVVETWEGTGEDRIQTGVIKKVKFWNKDKNIEVLFKHHGLFAKDNLQKQLSLADICAKLGIDTEE